MTPAMLRRAATKGWLPLVAAELVVPRRVEIRDRHTRGSVAGEMGDDGIECAVTDENRPHP
jgi:hypothetical protein